VFKYDRKADKIVGVARAGVEGPYGAHFGWNDKDLYVIGKGEESHNRGKVLGQVTKRIPMPNGGSSHSGAFVKYDGWSGDVLSDQNGLHGSALKKKRELLGIRDVGSNVQGAPGPGGKM